MSGSHDWLRGAIEGMLRQPIVEWFVRPGTYRSSWDLCEVDVRLANGRMDVRTWNGGVRPGPGVTFARQNLPLIVDHGRPNPNLDNGPAWGVAVGGSVMVWRSGLGVDRRGNLIYAAAPDQTVRGLARILIHAGAVRAMELDINSYWVTLNSYRKTGGRGARKLLAGMTRPALRYLSPDDRDFFAVSTR